MKKIISILIISITLFISTFCEADIFDQYYTIQVKALPMKQYKAGIDLYNKLKDKGYLPQLN